MTEPLTYLPAVDDELTVTIRLRLAAPDVARRIAERGAVTELPGWLYLAVQPLLDPGDVDLAGIDVNFPDFQPSRHQPRIDTAVADLAAQHTARAHTHTPEPR